MIKQGLDKLCLFCKAVIKKQGKYKKAQTSPDFFRNHFWGKL